MHKAVKEILFSEEQISQKCKELGKQITNDYKEIGQAPLLVGLLKGSVPFVAELMKHIDMDVRFDFMAISSYSGTESTGDVKVNLDLQTSIRGIPVLIVEDIVDTGRTLRQVKQLLEHKGASDVRIVSLLDKPDRRVVDIEADYVGFTIPDAFVVGFGLDYNQDYRNLPYVGVLKEEYYK